MRACESRLVRASRLTLENGLTRESHLTLSSA